MQRKHPAGFVFIWTVLLLLPLAPALLAQGSPGMPLAPGDRAPEMKGDDAAGEFRVVDYAAGKVTLLNFWATWCVPCRDELPMLQRMHEELGGEGLQIVAITYENLAPNALAEYAAEVGVDFPMIVAMPRIRRQWIGVEGALPNSYLIGADGRVIRRYVGAAPEQIEGLERDLRAVVAGKPLDKMVMPAKPAVATSADRPR